MSNESNPGDRQVKGTQIGIITSDKRDKTRTVSVEYLARHGKYGKFLKRRTRFHVHDAQNASKLGDRVEIGRCRPISKTKSWRLLRVVESAPEQLIAIEEPVV